MIGTCFWANFMRAIIMQPQKKKSLCTAVVLVERRCKRSGHLKLSKAYGESTLNVNRDIFQLEIDAQDGGQLFLPIPAGEFHGPLEHLDTPMLLLTG